MTSTPPPAPRRPCDAAACPATAAQDFTVGDRPPGVHGLEGWPEGAPNLTDTDLPTGRVIRFCNRHAHQLREAADLARPLHADSIRPTS